MHSRLSYNIRSLLCAAIVAMGAATACRAEDGQVLQNPTLKTLPAAFGPGSPIAVLPAGAVLHCSLPHPGASLTMLDGLLMSFVPQQAVPAQFKPFLASPTPLLALLGSLSVGTPLTPANLSSQLGLDVTRPVTLSWYMQDLAHGWVLSLPLGDEGALNGLLMGVLRPTSCILTDLGGGSGGLLECSNQSLPEQVLVLRSADSVFLFGSQAIARAAVAHTGVLADDPLLAKLGSGDLEIAISPKSLQPMLGMILGQLQHLTPAALHALRGMMMARIPAEAVSTLNMNLRLHTGVRDLNQLLDYAECVIEATNDVAVPALGKTLMGITGLEARVDVTPQGVSLRCSAYAAGIEALASAPLPMDAITQALAQLPWTPMSVSAQGRAPLDAHGPLVKPWCDALISRLNAAGLEPAVLGAMVQYLTQSQPENSLASSVPWLLSCSGELGSLPPANTTLMGYLKQVQDAPASRGALMVMPDQGPGFPASYFKSLAQAQTDNLALSTRLMTPFLGDDRWIDPVWRFREEDRPGKPAKLVCEDAYVTRSGLFGYSQHEFINRTIYFVDHRGPLCLLQLAQGSGLTWLDLASAPPAAPPIALNALLASVEPGSDRALVVRVMPVLPLLIDGLAAVETTAHTEIDAYLRQSQAIITAHAQDRAGLLPALLAQPMPVLVASLNIDADHNLYCVLPGNLRYPRPMVSTILRSLLAEVLPDAGHVGGSVLSTKASPGIYTLHVTCDLRGLALLSKSVGNAVWTQFLSAPDPLQAVQKAIGAPLDGEPNPTDQVILYNTMWPHERTHSHRHVRPPPSETSM